MCFIVCSPRSLIHSQQCLGETLFFCLCFYFKEKLLKEFSFSYSCFTKRPLVDSFLLLSNSRIFFNLWLKRLKVQPLIYWTKLLSEAWAEVQTTCPLTPGHWGADRKSKQWIKLNTSTLTLAGVVQLLSLLGQFNARPSKRTETVILRAAKTPEKCSIYLSSFFLCFIDWCISCLAYRTASPCKLCAARQWVTGNWLLTNRSDECQRAHLQLLNSTQDSSRAGKNW